MSRGFYSSNELFGRYELLYVDPKLYLDPPKERPAHPVRRVLRRTKTVPSNVRHRRTRGAAGRFIAETRKCLAEGLDVKDEWLTNGEIAPEVVQRELASNPEMRHAITVVAEKQFCKNEEISYRRYYRNVNNLMIRSRRRELERLLYAPLKDSLLIVDGVLSEASGLPPRADSMPMIPRTVRYVLANDHHWLTLAPPDPVLEVRVDTRAITAACNSTGLSGIAAAGWYPFARLMGVYRDERGIPFLDTLAIFYRLPMPLFDVIYVLRGKLRSERELVNRLIADYEERMRREGDRFALSETELRFRDHSTSCWALLVDLYCRMQGLEIETHLGSDTLDLYKRYLDALEKLGEVLGNGSRLPEIVAGLRESPAYQRAAPSEVAAIFTAVR